MFTASQFDCSTKGRPLMDACQDLVNKLSCPPRLAHNSPHRPRLPMNKAPWEQPRGLKGSMNEFDSFSLTVAASHVKADR